MTPEPGVSRSETVRRRLVRAVREEMAAETLVRLLRDDEQDLVVELACVLKHEPPRAGRRTAFLALDDQGQVGDDQLELVRAIVRLQTRGATVAEIARELQISPRQVRNVLGENAA